tara:strand:- start:3972 stop:4421 length:450 start_codon:yes stop_codon:yes gene_type:complete
LINILKKILNNQNSNENNDESKNLELLSGLMIEAAYTDGKVDEIELNKIKSSLINVFKEDPEEVEIVIKEALKNKNNSRSLHNYTSFINKNFNDDKKLLLIEALWEIVLSDGEIHDFESNLIRRLAGLLYISDVNSGNARKRALDKLQN